MRKGLKAIIPVLLSLCLASGCSEVQPDEANEAGLNVVPGGELTLTEGGVGVDFYVGSITVPFDSLHIAISADKPEQVTLSTDTIEGYLYPNAKKVEVRCVQDYVREDSTEVTIKFEVSANDPDYNNLVIEKTVVCVDNPAVQVEDDFCPDDPDKTEPGICGCGVADTSANTALASDGFASCLQMSAPETEHLGGFDMIEPDGYQVSEDGAEQLFAFALNMQPESDVYVTLTSSDDSEGVVDVEEHIFTPENWSDPVFVTVRGVDDEEVDGTRAFSVNITAISEDPNFSDVSKYMTFECIDNEPAVPDIIFSTKEISIYEYGYSSELYIQLASKPGLTEDGSDASVVVTFASDNKDEADVTTESFVFTAENWDVPQTVTITGIGDKIVDGTKEVTLSVTSSSNEVDCENGCYDNREYDPIKIEVLDVDVETQVAAEKSVKLRIMAANTTSGNKQSYDSGEGARIFRGLKPDIVLIQEFNYRKGTIDQFVASTFGEDFHYVRGQGDIPNGIISRYPIVQSGSWESNQVKNRRWDWAVIDIPGDRDLLAVSVHLHTSANTQEMGLLRNRIDKKLSSDNRDYYVVLGGDFNQPSWTPIRSNFGSLFVVGKAAADWPIDQEGKYTTNAKRVKQYDYLLCTPDFCKHEVPTVIGKHSYPKGHVVDSRVYGKKNELGDISPVQAKDSGATNMQHMAVVRDFEYKYKE
ncbi:MAG: hypothetical protein IJU23_08120 [Proteobacteria bacterium]|nr:hypothetical protein [Pseudomonadota bacterium]